MKRSRVTATSFSAALGPLAGLAASLTGALPGAGAEVPFTERVISTTAVGAGRVLATDVDGDSDVFSALVDAVTLLTSPTQVSMGDFDGDGDIALSDFAFFVDCLVDNRASTSCFPVFDYDADGSIDLRDFAGFQASFTGPIVLATSTDASGDEDETFSFVLQGLDTEAPAAVLTATVTQLPASGQLFQLDGTQFDEVPTVVTDPDGQVKFRANPDENGDTYASFAYSMADAATGQTSDPATVELTVLPVADPPSIGIDELTTVEDTPIYFRIPIIDPDLDHEGDTHTVRWISQPSPLAGTLYQVEADGITLGPPIVSGDFITNPDFWSYFEPAPDMYGVPLSIPAILVEDSYGLTNIVEITINVTPVNDPPTAASNSVSAGDLEPLVDATVNFRDAESNTTPDYIVTITTLPDQGSLYVGSVAPENLITPSNQVFTVSDYNSGMSLTMFFQPDQPVEPADPYATFQWSVNDGEFESNTAT